MKIRQGFVSNSSSSSFVCAVCNTCESGYDGMYDFKVWTCHRGHEFCESCMTLSPSKLAIDLSQADVEKAIIALELDHIDADEFRVIGKRESRREWILEYITCDGLSPAVCPICTFGSIPDSITLSYLYEKVDMNEKEVHAEIRTKYPNLAAWRAK